jgi:LmbE family N-acetylglucosaminyl deacetylase
MLQAALSDGGEPVRRVLALGAHADDIEIGCGATLLGLQRSSELEVAWVVLSADGIRESEARASAERFLEGASSCTIEIRGFRDGYLPYEGNAVKDVFEELKRELDPQLILTHGRHDLHQDHRLVCELTWNTWRDHVILEYEIPKYDGDLGAPNMFVPVSEELAREKVELLLESFPSQRGKHWFEAELFLGLMRVRGMEAHAPAGYAEAFACRKLLLEVG